MIKKQLVPILLMLAGSVFAVEQDDMVAHWRFNEGSGTTAFDATPNGHDGVIRGARYVPHGDGYALEFDGTGEHVDFGDDPAFRLGGQFTLEMWMKPCLDKESHLMGVVMGRNLRDYALAYNPNTEAAYLFVARLNARGDVEPGRWNHIAGVFDEDEIRIYINGRESWIRRRSGVDSSARADIGVPFLVGASSPEEPNPEAAGQSFKGRIAEAAVYGRALGADEIKHRYAYGNLTGEPEIMAAYVPPLNIVAVDIHTHPLGELPEDAALAVSLLRDGAKVASERIEGARSRPLHAVEFNAAGLPAGKYTVSAGAVGAETGESLGRVSKIEVDVAGHERFPQETPRGKRLNNLVTELVNVSGAESGEEVFAYRREREGWTFVRARLDLPAGSSAELVCRSSGGDEDILISARGGGTPPAWAGEGDVWEAMRHQPAGEYELIVRLSGGAGMERLIVREVPEITWMHTGPSTWARDGAERNPEYFVKRGALRGANVVRTDPRRSILPAHRPFIDAWQEAGRRVVVSAMLARPDGRRIVERAGPDGEPEWIDHFFAEEPAPFPSPAAGVLKWLDHYQVEGIHGMALDELHTRFHYAPIWEEAIRIFHERTGTSVGLYTGDVFRYPVLLESLMRRVIATGGRFYWERYEHDHPTTLTLWNALQNIFMSRTEAWVEAFPPEISDNTLLHLGVSSIPGMTLNTWPRADFKVFLDMRMNMIANEEIFEKIGGFSMWNSAALEEETVVWLGKLHRHYWIEGRRDILSDTPYYLAHIHNPGFEAGLEGWTVSEAAPGAVRADESLGFGSLQGLYTYSFPPDDVVVMRRSAGGPNTISQTVTGLEPGRLYAVDIVAADFNNMKEKVEQTVGIDLRGGIELEDYGYAWLRTNRRGVSLDYPERNSAWMTFCRKVFRALGEEAELVVSDWESPEEPGGSTGQETMIGSVRVRPYLDLSKFRAD